MNATLRSIADSQPALFHQFLNTAFQPQGSLVDDLMAGPALMDVDTFEPVHDLSRLDPVTLYAAAQRLQRLAQSGNVSESLGALAQSIGSRILASDDPSAELAELTAVKRSVPAGLLAPQTRRFSALPEDKILALGGNSDKIIRTVLIANNGLAAEKIALGLREYARVVLGDPRAIRIVVMATPEDQRLNMRYLTEADVVVPVAAPLPGAAQPYADIGLICETASMYGADAIHPGWGWASEDFRLPQACEKAGLIFMGPGSRAMKVLGDKGFANFLYQQSEAGRNTMVKWSGSKLPAVDGEVTDAHLAQAAEGFNISTFEECKQSCEEVGFPVMIKARGVGGGRGMKRVYRREELTRELWEEVSRAANGTGIFVMKLAVRERRAESVEAALRIADDLKYPVYVRVGDRVLKFEDELDQDDRLVESGRSKLQNYLTQHFSAQESAARAFGTSAQAHVTILGGGQKHIEVQILSDGSVALPLGLRDCSMQYNNQKRIEETAFVNEAIRRQLKAAAAGIAESVGYVGYGTVEFLVDEETGQIVFLEVNTRVQVEHPVTEMDSGVRFIATDMMLRQGVPLHNIPWIKQLIQNRIAQAQRISSISPLDPPAPVAMKSSEMLTEVPDLGAARLLLIESNPETHTIALRIVAERLKGRELQTAPGQKVRIALQGIEGAWYYSAIPDEGEIGLSSDPQFAHVFVTAPTRDQAILKALRVLDNIKALGETGTNVPILRALLQHESFQGGRYDNATLENLVRNGALPMERPSHQMSTVSGAILQAAIRYNQKIKDFYTALRRGQIPREHEIMPVSIPVVSVLDGIKHEFDATLSGVSADGRELVIVLVARRENYPGKKDHRPDAVIVGKVSLDRDGLARVSIGSAQQYVQYYDNGDHLQVNLNQLPEAVLTQDTDPSREKAAMPGKVIKVLVQPGQTVEKGQPLMIIEAMKMEQIVRAARAGTVNEIPVEAGVNLAMGADLVRYVKTPEIMAARSRPYDGSYDVFAAFRIAESSLSAAEIRGLIENIMQGYLIPGDRVADAKKDVFLQTQVFYAPLVKKLMAHLRSRAFWGAALERFVSGYLNAMPEELYQELLAFAAHLRQRNPGERTDGKALATEVAEIVARYDGIFAAQEEVYKKAGFRDHLRAFLAAEGMQDPLLAWVRDLALRFGRDEALFADRTLINPFETIQARHAAFARDPHSPVAIKADWKVDLTQSQVLWRRVGEEVQSRAPMRLVNELGATLIRILGEEREEFLRVQVSPEALKVVEGLSEVLNETRFMALHEPEKVLVSIQQLDGEIKKLLGRDDLAPRLRADLDSLEKQIEEVRKNAAGILLSWASFNMSSAIGAILKSEQISPLDIKLFVRVAGLAREHGRQLREGLATRVMRHTLALVSVIEPYLPMDASRVYSVHRSHQSVVSKAAILTAMIRECPSYGIAGQQLAVELRALATMSGDGDYYKRGTKEEISALKPTRVALSQVAAFARSMTTTTDTRSMDQQIEDLREFYRKIARLQVDDPAGAFRRLQDFAINHARPIFHQLIPMMGDDDQRIRDLALLTYGMRVNRARDLTDVRLTDGGRSTVSYVYRYAREARFGRFGQTVALSSVSQLRTNFPAILQNFADGLSRALDGSAPASIVPNGKTLRVLLHSEPLPQPRDEDALADRMADILNAQAASNQTLGIKLISIGMADTSGRAPLYFHYRFINGRWVEDRVYRHIEMPLAFQLDFERLIHFNLISRPTLAREIHVFEGSAKQQQGRSKVDDKRLFVRALVRSNREDEITRRYVDIDNLFVKCLDELSREGTLDDDRAIKDQTREIFLNILPEFSGEDSQSAIAEYLIGLVREHKDRLNHLKISHVDFKFVVRSAREEEQLFHLHIRNFPKTRLKTTLLRETVDLESGAVTEMDVATGISRPVVPYYVLSGVEKRRQKAHGYNTTFAYDVPDVVRDEVKRLWEARGLIPPEGRPLVEVKEMYLTPEDRLAEADLVDDAAYARDPGAGRPKGANVMDLPGSQKTNAAAFRLLLRTPEAPQGREAIVMIANDVSVSAAFKPSTAALYDLAAQRAVREGLPFMVFQANQGASFAIEAEIVKRFHVEFKDEAKGLSEGNVASLYLNSADIEDLNRMREGAVYVRRSASDLDVPQDAVVVVDAADEKGRYRIVAIPGSAEGLDADSLNGSGRIAGASERARKNFYTSTIVSGYLSVGIGAYLSRLLGEVIQNGPIVLTGYKILNAVLQARAYLSEEQIGGRQQIMLPNGVAYWGAHDDNEAIAQWLRNLSRVPVAKDAKPPVMITRDPVSRVLCRPTPDLRRNSYFVPEQLADAGEFDPRRDEKLAEFGRNVRAYSIPIGGLPIDLLLMEKDPKKIGITVPADPGDTTSTEIKLPQSPNVLEPDGSFKIAEVIREASRQQRGVIIMPDIRGFSGGTLHMFLQILKRGSDIVGAIEEADVPIYMYLEPGGQLRGGAWVVFDRAISGNMRVRMFADPDGRGGVLEPKGQVELLGARFQPEVIKRIIRDNQGMIAVHLARLREELRTAEAQREPDADKISEIRDSIELLEFDPSAVEGQIAEANATGNTGEAKRLGIELEEYYASRAGLAQAALQMQCDLQHNGQALVGLGAVDEMIPFESLRLNLYRVYNIDLEVLDFERLLKREFPLLTVRELRVVRREYEAHLFARFRECTSTFDACDTAWRESQLARIRKSQALRYGTDMIALDPVAVLDQVASFFSGILDEMDDARRSAFAAALAQMRGAAELAPRSSRPGELYARLWRNLKIMGYWRTEDSDPAHPEFFDAQRRVVCAELDESGRVTLTLLSGSESGWSDHVLRGMSSLAEERSRPDSGMSTGLMTSVLLRNSSGTEVARTSLAGAVDQWALARPVSKAHGNGNGAGK